MTALPDMRVVMDDLRVHGDRVEYHWTLTGTITQDPVAPDAASASAASSFG